MGERCGVILNGSRLLIEQGVITWERVCVLPVRHDGNHRDGEGAQWSNDWCCPVVTDRSKGADHG